MISRRSLITNLVVLVLAFVILFIGNRIASRDAQLFISGSEYVYTVEARVIRIVDVAREDFILGGEDVKITFEALPRGFFTRSDDEIITATQEIASFLAYDVDIREVQEGDRVVLMFAGGEWRFFEHVRMHWIFILAAVFAVLMILLGRSKGFKSIVSLFLTCAAIFTVFIPALLSGKNIYLWAILVCLYTIVITLFMVSGVNKKSSAAIAGCIGGVISAGLLTLLMIWVTDLTGVLDQESISLLFLREDYPINLRSIIFAGIIIGAVGALMDVAMSISSAMWEIKQQADDLSFKGLFKSGMNIGRDIMGTMANTLVLAYIGGSLSITLLLMTFSTSIVDLLNREMIIVDLLQAIIGSMGILLTAPLTALICAFLFSRGSDFYDRPLRTRWQR